MMKKMKNRSVFDLIAFCTLLVGLLAPSVHAILDWFDPSCAEQQPPVFDCSDNADSLVVVYPEYTMVCSGIYGIEEAGPTPNITVVSANSTTFYTLLLVDTSTTILHFGSVNIPGSSLQSGLDLSQAPDIFSAYRGPSPPCFLQIIPPIRKSLFNYEWILVEQVSGERDVPTIEGNFGFDYNAFLADYDDGAQNITSYFSSGFCA